MADTYRISVERLENGFEVTVPDIPAIEKAEKAASKKSGSSTGVMPYTGDLTKSYAAKSTKEVLALVKTAIEGIPANEFDSAFEEAGQADD